MPATPGISSRTIATPPKVTPSLGCSVPASMASRAWPSFAPLGASASVGSLPWARCASNGASRSSGSPPKKPTCSNSPSAISSEGCPEPALDETKRPSRLRIGFWTRAWSHPRWGSVSALVNSWPREPSSASSTAAEGCTWADLSRPTDHRPAPNRPAQLDASLATSACSGALGPPREPRVGKSSGERPWRS
jgi:hypothetical protein